MCSLCDKGTEIADEQRLNKNIEPQNASKFKARSHSTYTIPTHEHTNSAVPLTLTLNHGWPRNLALQQFTNQAKWRDRERVGN